jgi:hypothetical protein
MDSLNREAFTCRILSALAMEDNAMARGTAAVPPESASAEAPHQSLPTCAATGRTHRYVPAAAMPMHVNSAAA